MKVQDEKDWVGLGALANQVEVIGYKRCSCDGSAAEGEIPLPNKQMCVVQDREKIQGRSVQ